MTRVYYKEAIGCFIVYDVTRRATFDSAIKWKEDLDAKVRLSDGRKIPCVLLGNKVCFHTHFILICLWPFQLHPNFQLPISIWSLELSNKHW